jgi:methionyl-tRNA formyltransferase
MPAGHEMPMRVIFLTQEDPFYLTEAFRHILDHVPPGVMVVAAVVLGGSPFGERLSLVGKVRRTYEVFGPRFVGLYGWRFLRAKLGRSRTVASLFRRRGIEVLTPAGSVNAPEFLEALRLRYPDLLVSVGANQVFRRALIDLAPRGCLNLHSALLPRHRGLMPSFWALKHGDAETGVSVFFVDEGIDTGPLLVQRRFRIRDRSLDSVLRDAKRAGAEAVVEALAKVRQGGFDLLPNDSGEGSYHSFPTRQDVRDFLGSGNRFV